jgi:hypothetical protein
MWILQYPCPVDTARISWILNRILVWIRGPLVQCDTASGVIEAQSIYGIVRAQFEAAGSSDPVGRVLEPRCCCTRSGVGRRGQRDRWLHVRPRVGRRLLSGVDQVIPRWPTNLTTRCHDEGDSRIQWDRRREGEMRDPTGSGVRFVEKAAAGHRRVQQLPRT